MAAEVCWLSAVRSVSRAARINLSTIQTGANEGMQTMDHFTVKFGSSRIYRQLMIMHENVQVR